MSASHRHRPRQAPGAHAQSILEWALDAVITADHRSVILAWNPEAERVFGWKAEEAVGRTLMDVIIPPRLRAAHVEGIRRLMGRDGGDLRIPRRETVGLRRDGAEIPIELTVFPESARGGWVFTAFVRDLSARDRAHAALRESEERFRSAFEYTGTGMALVAPDGRFLEVNSEICRMLGYTAEELQKLRFADITPSEDQAASAEAVRRLVSGEVASLQLQKSYIRRDGRRVPILLTTALLRDPAGTPRYFVSQMLDLTPQKAAEDALRQSEATFRSAFVHANTGMCLVSPAGTLLRVNPTFCEMLDMSEDQIVGRSLAGLTHPDEREEARLLLQRMLDGTRESGAMVKRYLRPDGREVWAALTATLIRDAAGEPGYFVAQVQDITRRKVAEEALRASEKTYRLLFENNPNPMCVLDAASLAFLAVNDAAVELYGYARAEFRAMSAGDVQPPGEPAPAFQGAGSGYCDQGEWRHRKKDGTVFPVEIATHGIRFEGRDAVLTMITDLSERKRAEEALRRSEAQLQQAAKMEAIGRLAGGIAHDFNNLLTIIQGYAQLLSKRLARGEPAGREVEEIRYAAARGNSLTQQLLAFSRRQVLRFKALDLNAVVAAMDQLLRRVIGDNIELVVSPEPGLGRVKADPGQLDQVILNLALNARDAMPAGGRLTIETRSHGPDEPPGGPWIMLAVGDTGTGMDPDTLSHIFEPFFTTKEPGRGTGLGLATVYGIVQQSGGAVRVSSGTGQGSTFRIYLPRVPADAADAESDLEASPVNRGNETILVVEDEPRVRALAAGILRDYGYTVLEAAGGPEALRLVESDSPPVHLVVSDVVMPRMSGPDLAARFASHRPAARFLFISGYVDLAQLRDGALPPDAAFLPKPFTEEQLAQRVREVLEKRNGKGGSP